MPWNRGIRDKAELENEVIKRYYATESMSYGVLAEKFKLTRSQVAGIIYRAKVDGRVTPEQAKIKAVSMLRDRPPNRKKARKRPEIASVPMAKVPLPPEFRLPKLPIWRTPKVVQLYTKPVDGVSFMDREDKQCVFFLTDVGYLSKVCGDPVLSGTSYCREHIKRMISSEALKRGYPAIYAEMVQADAGSA